MECLVAWVEWVEWVEWACSPVYLDLKIIKTPVVKHFGGFFMILNINDSITYFFNTYAGLFIAGIFTLLPGRFIANYLGFKIYNLLKL